MYRVALWDVWNRNMRDPGRSRYAQVLSVVELTHRQFILHTEGVRNIKQPKQSGSQLRHSTEPLPSKSSGRTKPGMLSADYIVGLTDGEGSFTVYLNPPNKKHGSVNYRVQCRYYIKMREDDRSLLEKVQMFWGCGKIYFQKEYRMNQRDNYRFEIFNYQLLKGVVIPFFRKHPLQSKRINDFELFCKILDLALEKAHHTKSGLRKIKKLKGKMHA